MEQYILLAEIENTVFFYHAVQETTNKENTYNVYRALDHIKLLNDKQTAVIIFDVLTEHTMDVIAIQHKDSSSLKKFDKGNLEQTFSVLKKIDTPRKNFILNYYIDKETYETNIIEGILPVITNKEITAIEYVEFQGETISEETSSNLETVAEEPVEESAEKPVVEESTQSTQEPVVEESTQSTQEPVVEDGNLDQPMKLEEPIVPETPKRYSRISFKN